MKTVKIVVLSLLLCLVVFPGFCETIYIYTYEVCSDEPVPTEFQVKEGILDGLFDAGHIVFDDISDSSHPDLLAGDTIDTLLTTARKGGAYYLLGARIISHVLSETDKDQIESTASYYLYDVYSGKLLKEGITKVDNVKNKNKLSKQLLWFQLGHYISDEISRVYENKQKE
ncbi:MAG: hypothetical protein OQK82_09195 [Candidatus Pacearchaeota archaeon]|nr:hypothetical protein [Candidatus Pacearchaeota archaeon]